jgi:hypothetical protein
MRFILKDLMVMFDEDGPHCGSCSVISCALPTVECGGITCGITSVIHLEEFDVMKLELDQALAIVRATAELESQTRVGPETVEEAERLENALTQALEQVRRTKADLERH